jgi:MFS transporter, SP family, general alpha glucoside:H+ symporter
LDLLFERGVSARKFAKTEVDVFDEDVSVDEGVVGRYERKISVGGLEVEGDGVVTEVEGEKRGERTRQVS